MKSFMNEGSVDRALRVLLGFVLLFAGWSGAVGGTLGWIFKIGGLLPLLTGVVGWCALYQVFGFSTRARTPNAV